MVVSRYLRCSISIRMKDSLAKTIEAAQVVLLAEISDIDLRIDAISAYITALNEILTELNNSSEREQPKKSELEQLSVMHSEIVEVATALLGNTSTEIKALKAKGKAFLAYTDTMPKRVSLRPQKKW